MRYWDVTRAINGSDVNPRTINDYLSDEFVDAQGNKTGYDQWGNTGWAGVQKYSDGKIKLETLTPRVGQTKEDAIDAQIRLNQPVMAQVTYQGRFLFNVNQSYQTDLNNGTLSDGFKQEFQNHGIALSANDQITIRRVASNRWWVTDSGRNLKYIVRSMNNVLNIYPRQMGHWVVIVGLRVNNHYPIHDPGGYAGTDMGAYGDEIGSMVLVKPANGYQPMQRIAAHSPVELLVTDQLGRRTGYDPTTQSIVNEIPGAIYTIEEPIVDQESGQEFGDTQKVLYLPQADAGSFVLTVIGIGDGPYALDFQTMDSDGNFHTHTIQGMASLGSSHDYPYDYDGSIIVLSEVGNQPPSLTVPTEISGQYSDIVSFNVTATDPDNQGNTLVFSASGLPSDLLLTDLGYGSAIVSGTLNTAPGSYTAEITVTDPSGLSDTKPVSIVVSQEGARATYTGPMLVSTSSTSSSTATVPLRATIQDITAVDPVSDPDPGNITNATVSFVNRANNAVLCSANVVLLDRADQTVGSATCDWSVNIGSSSGTDFVVGIVVDGYYTRNSTEDDVVVVVSKPVSNFISGGGYFVNQSPGGTYAGNSDANTNFGLTIKFTKKLTNLQGRFTIIVRQNGHVYQIKSTSLNSLVTVPYDPTLPRSGTAELVGKANIIDVTDPINPLSVASNATLNVVMKDNGEPENADLISISLWNRNGTLLYSSNWNGISTVLQLLSGGNLNLK
jgi:hypothetical protein